MMGVKLTLLPLGGYMVEPVQMWVIVCVDVGMLHMYMLVVRYIDGGYVGGELTLDAVGIGERDGAQ